MCHVDDQVDIYRQFEDIFRGWGLGWGGGGGSSRFGDCMHVLNLVVVDLFESTYSIVILHIQC